MENAYTEYKRELTDGLEKEVVAFLNTLGGDILIGVEDNGEVVGIDAPDDISLKVADRLKNNISPSVIGLFQIDILGEQKKYIKISVAGGLEKPYYIKKYGMSPKGCFLRIGTQSTPMEQAQIETLFSHRVNRTLSTIISPRQDLTFTQLRIFYEENGFDTSGDHFFRNLGMYTSDGRFNYFAMLLSDQNDVTMKVAQFRGTDKNEIITSKEFGYCCILKSVYNILAYLDNYNLPSVEITYPKRVEKFLVDKVALREAVINAIVHNDYISGGAPLFEIYDDRITVVSYGGLVGGLTQEEFFSGRSMPRNRELMRVFRDMEFVENFGSGIQRILRVYDRSIFQISDNFIITEFKYDPEVLKKVRNAVVHGEPVNVPVNEPVKLTATAQKVLALISEQNNITLEILTERIGVSRETVKRAIKLLKQNGYIERVGSDKAGYWKILK